MRKLTLASCFTLAAAAGFLAAVLTSHGCASNCGANCPTTTVFIGDNDNTELDIKYILMSGPACPPYGYACTGDDYSTVCTHVSVTGQTRGACDVTIIFGDRDTEIVHLEFGPPPTQGCCKGYPVIGPSTYTIPDKPTGGPIYVADASTDAVTVVSDASTDAGHDAGADAKSDARTDAATAAKPDAKGDAPPDARGDAQADRAPAGSNADAKGDVPADRRLDAPADARDAAAEALPPGAG